MKNSQLLPFERNRYYAGKVLASADFVAEQMYMNNKRRFLNHIMYGSGVVCGLNVTNLDDMSILVESGVAIDTAGREIVVESSVVKKLSTLEGYDKLDAGRAFLCIRYNEEEVHPVYCTSGDVTEEGTKEYEYNRIDEGYELYLVKAEADEATSFDIDDEFLFEETLLDDGDFLLKLRVPAAIPKGKAVRFVLEISKKTSRSAALTFHAMFQMPVFTDENGRHELEIDIVDMELAEGETVCRDYWVNTHLTELEETKLIARKEDIRIRCGGQAVEMNRDVAIRLVLVDLSPEELTTREIGKLSLEMRNIRQINGQIKLAEMEFVSMGTSLILSGLREHGIKNYIATPGETYHRSRYLSYFKEKENQKRYQGSGENTPFTTVETTGMPMHVASGRVEIPLRANMKKSEVRYSEEIVHGLGKGNVYVAVGLEYQSEEPHAESKMRNTIYGNAGLFKEADLMKLETAVRVMNDKGSFQIAVKLLGEQKGVIVAANWVAIRVSGEKGEDAAVFEEMRIVPEHPTVQLKVKDKYFFEVHFENMQPCRLSYELTEMGSGELDQDGVYTAPAKEGVYEIRIYCTDKPSISTYVYAIVSK